VSSEEITLPDFVVGTQFTCRVCGLVFATLKEQHTHFKTPLHVVNLKRSLVGLESVSDEDEINSSDDEQNMNDNEDYDVYTIDDTVDINSCTTLSNQYHEFSEGYVKKTYDKKKGSVVIFRRKNSLWEFSISSAIFGLSLSKSSGHQDPWLTLRNTMSIFHLGEHLHSCVLVLQSGKFAGAIFEGRKCILHKVFRRYTVRAKSGGGQSSFDNNGRKAKSAGSTLRRYGEQALKEDIQELLLSWLPYLQSCVVILTAIPKTMKHYVFGEKIKQVLRPDDLHVRSIPFMIKKPTFEEIKLVHEKCISIEFVRKQFEVLNEELSLATISEEEVQDVPVQTRESSNGNSLEAMSQLEATIPEDGCVLLQQLMNNLRNGSSEDFTNLMSSIEDTCVSICGKSHLSQWLSASHSLEYMETPLHIAAEGGRSREVFALLQAGANPTVKDIRNRYPYFLAKDKETRDAFRRYRGIEEQSDGTGFKWDWNLCGVPVGITNEMIKEKKDKDKEKKKRSKQRKREAKQEIAQRDQQLKLAEESETADKIELEESVGECSLCGKTLGRQSPLEIFGKYCCSSACVVMLRRKLTADAAEKRARGEK
jgi:hypothetical protein